MRLSVPQRPALIIKTLAPRVSQLALAMVLVAAVSPSVQAATPKSAIINLAKNPSIQDTVPEFDGADDGLDIGSDDSGYDDNGYGDSGYDDNGYGDSGYDDSGYQGKGDAVNEEDIVEDDGSISAPFDEALASSRGEGLGANMTLLPQFAGPEPVVPLNAISPTTLKTFVEVIDLVRREYVEPVSDEVLLNDAMSGMLTKLDSHAEFLDAEAYESLRAFTQGDVGVVGLYAEYEPANGHWVVTEVTPNSPAAKERIKVGDYIHQINEVKLTDKKTANDIEQMLTGLAGTQVELVVSRAGRRKRTITVQRNQMREQEIVSRLDQGIAIIKLPVFQNNSRQRILLELVKLQAPISGLVLDLRDNPGGVLEAAVDIAGLFMADTDVVQIEGRGGVERTLKTSPKALLAGLPVVILQNRYSASAAEVLASSLQTRKRAQIVGEISYGKGSVQSVIPVNDEQAIKLTVAHYLTADGRQIDDIGVTPDIRLDDDEDLWEEQALAIILSQPRPEGMRFVLKSTQ